MQPTMKNPATGGNRCGAKEDIDKNRPDSRSEPEGRKGLCFIHVLKNGVEQRFAHRPGGLPCLRVETDGNLERTWTWNVAPNTTGHPEFVIPPGDGWQMGPRGAGSTCWVRPARAEVAQ